MQRATTTNNMTLVYKLIVSYNGFRFNGFQRQHQSSSASSSSSGAAAEQQPQQKSGTISSHTNGVEFLHARAAVPKRPHYESKTGRPKGVPLTVQECLEQVLLDYIGQQTTTTRWSLLDLQLRFAGRTDKGVHAMGQVITVHFPEVIVPSSGNVVTKKTKTTSSSSSSAAAAAAALRTCDIAPWEIQKAINSRLPVDISVEHVECLGRISSYDDPPLFDPRRDATSKQYSYTLKYLRKHDRQPEQEKLLLGGGIHIFRNALDPPCIWYERLFYSTYLCVAGYSLVLFPWAVRETAL
jgi:tRNA pseudouridine(38-40) synthase